jgi:hypothetical protein
MGEQPDDQSSTRRATTKPDIPHTVLVGIDLLSIFLIVKRDTAMRALNWRKMCALT